jgi:hypothetical protein
MIVKNNSSQQHRGPHRFEESIRENIAELAFRDIHIPLRSHQLPLETIPILKLENKLGKEYWIFNQ